MEQKIQLVPKRLKKTPLYGIIFLGQKKFIPNIGGLSMSNFILTQGAKKVNEFAAKKRESRIIAEKLGEMGLRARSARMSHCSENIEMAFCPECGKRHVISTILCRDRLCPICQRKLAMKRFHDMCAVFEKLELGKKQVSFLTLTVRNIYGSELAKTIESINEGWNRWARQKVFKNAIGWARSLEITYNTKTKQWHPHLHIIAIWQEGASAPPAWEISTTWQMACRLPYNVIIDIRDVYDTHKGSASSAALEACKYSLKTSELLKNVDNNEWKTLIHAIGGVRMVSYGGEIKKVRAELKIKDEEIKEEKELICKNCGTSLQTELYKWAGNEYELVEE